MLTEADRFLSEDLALVTCVGDPYLVAKNAVVRNVRRMVVASGYRFTPKPTFDYATLPLLALADIYATKTIPYVDNVSRLRELRESHPKTFSLDELLLVGLRRSYVTHESVHCILHESFRPLPRPQRDHEVLLTQLAEAGANATELVGSAFANSAVHRSLYAANTHLVFMPEEADSFRALRREIGFVNAFGVVLMGYLCSNFLWKEASPASIDDALSTWLDPRTLSRKSRLAARALFGRALELNYPFRLRTTALYYRHAGDSRALTSILGFDFLALVRTFDGPLERCRRFAMKLVKP